MIVSVGIVAHEKRIGMAEKLRANVHAYHVSYDNGLKGCEGNHLELLKCMSVTGADWICVLEDDAVPCQGFRQQLHDALTFAPAPIVGLYLGTGNPSYDAQRQIRQAVLKPAAWIMADCLVSAVGFAVKGEMVHALIEDLPLLEGEFPLRITRWAQTFDQQICYTNPSLVNHADVEPIGPHSVDRLERKAWRFGTREDWHTPSVDLGKIIHWSKGT
jgi:hypothetical protein